MFKILLCISAEHDWRLVVAAALVCLPATVATFFLYSRVPEKPGWRRWTWLAMTGLVAGSGIWTTHFVAMLAFKTGLPTGYAAAPTLASLAVAVLSTGFGFGFASSAWLIARPQARAIAGGLVVGLGITLMHYVGMSGYRTAGVVQWDLLYVAASVLIGAVLAGAALAITSPGAGWNRRIASSAVLTLAIVGMHFTGMTAVSILPDASIAVPASLLSDSMMAALAVAGATLIAATALGGVALDAATRNGSLRRLREALDAMPEGLAFYDATDGLVAWNTQYADLCRPAGIELKVGLAFEALLTAGLSHGAYPDAVGRETEWLGERKAVHTGNGPSLIQREQGGRWLRVTDRRTADGGTVSVSVDITELKRAEAELQLARAEAEAAAAAKAEFLANMSHELRTPLTSIIGFTTLAQEQPDLTELSRNYVERVGDASRALLCSVNDILDFSKLEAGQVAFHPQPVSPTKLSRSSLDLFTPQAGAKDLDLVLDVDEADADLVVTVDPDRVRQVLLNLVGNAVKFTDAGSVTLRARYDRQRGALDVEVIDTGEGVAPDKQDRLFKRFSQVDGSLTRSKGGTGLGLAICKGLVEAMGGEIGVESHAGRGSRFWFSIPAPTADAREAARSDPAIDLPPLDGVRVLVVDDHAGNRQLARLFLAGVGVEVLEADGGEEGVRMAAEWPFDVILMDLRMPTLDGPGAMRRIRDAAGPNDTTPILAFTADADAERTVELGRMGFQGVVSKPIEAATLIAAIARSMSTPESREHADAA